MRHDGVSTIDYVDQLTLLLFLKMADKRSSRTAFRGTSEIVAAHLGWRTLLDARDDHLKADYENILDKLGGRAAVVVPDNVLFEGGQGEALRRRLLASATYTPCRPALSDTRRASVHSGTISRRAAS